MLFEFRYRQHLLLPGWLVMSAFLAGVTAADAPQAELTPGTARSPADAAWISYQSLRFDPANLPQFPDKDRAMFMAWLNANYVARAAAALWFYQTFAADARHWQAAYDHVQLTLNFIDGVSEHQRARARELNALLKLEAPEDIRARVWGNDAATEILQHLRSTGDAKPDFAAARRAIEAYAVRFPQADSLGTLQRIYISRLAEEDRPAAETWVDQLLSSSNSKVREVAQGYRRQWNRETPLEMSFTALDGREVDLRKLRGKVVLIEFWATWCGPCVEEIPNIRQLYAEHRDEGFEVVGIALENSPTAKPKLQSLMEREGMTWPQYFGARGFKTDLAVRYSVNAIPAMFLLDRDGRIVSTDVRGAELASEVRRLLGGS